MKMSLPLFTQRKASQVVASVKEPAHVIDAGSQGRERSPEGEHSNPLPLFLPGESRGQRYSGLQSMGAAS